jgi:tetratricopeptide (TPR) repeat protein
MFAAQGGTDNQRRALDFIERNLHDPPAALADLRAKATLYAAHPARLRREAAIPLLEELIRAEREPPADDELLLAELYAERGDPARGDKQIGRLAKLHAKEPRCLAAQVKALLRRSCYAEADSWLRRLEAMAPGEFSSVRLRAEILFGENNPDAAIRVLRDFADRGAAGSSDWQSRIELVVANLEDFGQRLSRQGQRSIASKCIVAAEDLARQSAQREQKQAIRLARFLGAHGRLTEALRIVETTWENSDPNLVAEALGAISDSGACDPHQLKRIESLVTAALHKYGRGVLPLRHVSASVQIEQQRYAGAEVGLRQWLEEDPEAVIPLNNLSFLLALEGKDLDEASRLIDRGLAVAGPLPALLDTRAAVHAAGKRYAEAIADLDAAIADTPSPIWYYHQAQLHWSMDHKPAAQKALRRAEELGLEPEILHPLDRQLRSALLRGI